MENKYYKHRVISTNKPYDVDFGWDFSTLPAKEYLQMQNDAQNWLMERDKNYPHRDFKITSSVEISKQDYDNQNDYARPISEYNNPNTLHYK